VFGGDSDCTNTLSVSQIYEFRRLTISDALPNQSVSVIIHKRASFSLVLAGITRSHTVSSSLPDIVDDEPGGQSFLMENLKSYQVR
jgi:hypothetical protein